MREAKGDKEKGCEPRALYRDRWRAARVSRLAAAMGLLRDGQGSEGGRSDDAAGQHADVDAIVVIWLGCQRCPRREGRPGRRERHHSRHRCGDLAEGVAIGSSRGLISPSTSLSWLATISDRSRNTSPSFSHVLMAARRCRFSSRPCRCELPSMGRRFGGPMKSGFVHGFGLEGPQNRCRPWASSFENRSLTAGHLR